MSSAFNRNNNMKKSELFIDRNHENNHKYPQVQNENKNPVKISSNIKFQNNEINDKNQKQKPIEQHIQKRDSGKKAKRIISNKKNSSKEQKEENQNVNNNNEKENNKNEEYTKIIEKKLRDNSLNKSKYKKKIKNNDFLKSSININAESELSPYINNNNKNENNNTNNFCNPKTSIKKENKNINNLFNQNFGINIKQTSIFNFEEEKGNKNSEINQMKEKESDKNIQIKNNFNINNEESIPKRSSNKKLTYQSQIIFKDQKQASNFIVDNKKNIKSSSKENIFIESNKKNNNIKNIIIPFLNRTKENNCFLNVLIQTLFNLGEFKNEILEKNSDLAKHNKTFREFYNLFKLYEEEQIKSLNNKGKIEATLSVNNLRNYLNEIYKCYRPGETGDPMETLGYILDIIHQIYCKKRKIDYKNVENCKCPSHQYFFLKLVDIIYCPNCESKKTQIFNKDCYMTNIFIKEITNKLHGKNFNSYNLKLFSKLKENNETYGNENKTKIPGCNCNKKIISSYEKKLKLTGSSSQYLIINITWAEEFPNMLEILTAFSLIPISENIENLFPFEEYINTKINNIYYIKSIILYGIYHYVCIIYIKDEKKWAVIDDKNIKYINKYYDLIDSLLRNHLMPVGIIYSKDRNDQISKNEIESNSLNKDEYKKLYQLCRDIDLRRGLKVSDLIVSKNSFNEDNENYLNNNYFYKSILEFLPSYNDNIKNNIPLENKKNEKNLFNHKTHITPNNFKNLDNNKNINIFNRDNNIGQTEIKGKNNIINGRKIMGDFSNKNLKGGILIFSNPSINENNRNNEKSEKKEENNFLDFGKNYVGDDD